VLIVEERFEEFQREDRLRVIEAIDCVLRNSIEVLASKEATGQRAPGNEPIVVFREERFIIYFYIVPNKHVILVLPTDRLMKVEPFTNSQGF
jgi:hypothetical protein